MRVLSKRERSESIYLDDELLQDVEYMFRACAFDNDLRRTRPR